MAPDREVTESNVDLEEETCVGTFPLPTSVNLGSVEFGISNQSPFQDPKLEVPTIYMACIRPKFQGISPLIQGEFGKSSKTLVFWDELIAESRRTFWMLEK